MFQEFKLTSASVSSKYELAGLLNKGQYLLTAQFNIAGNLYQLIIDTGATVSFVPEKGKILTNVAHKILPASLNVILADDRATHIDRKVLLPLKPKGSKLKDEIIPFYIHKNAGKILGYDALLGLDHLKLFDLHIYVKQGRLYIYHNDYCIGEETAAPGNYKALVRIDERVEQLQIDPLTLSIVKKYRSVFTDIDSNPIRGRPMRIFTTHNRPIYVKQRNYNQSETLLMKEHISSLLDKGIIEPTSSGYAAQSRIIPKKSGASRLVVNYIPLNRCTHRNSYALPQIADIFGAIQGQRFFSTLDCAQGFYQILVDPKDRHKTGFSTPLGNFQFIRCPFGFRNSPAVFQSEMNNIFYEGLYTKCVIYIDDILIFGRTRKEHDENLRWVLFKCSEYNVKIKLDKCCFGQESVDYLGFTISGDSIKPLEDKVSQISKTGPPKNKKELRSIIGKLNFYSRFIPRYSKQLEPLREVFRHNRDFQWKPHYQQILYNIFKSLDEAQTHALVSPSEHKYLELYILEDSIEAILLDKSENLIVRASRFLLSAERNYSVAEQQLMGLVFAVNKFRLWLEPEKFTVRLGTKDLEKALKLVHKPSRIDNWLLKMPEGYDTFILEIKESLQSNMAAKIDSHVPEEIYYIDGACKGNGKPDCQATWAVCAEFDRELESSGFVEESASNNSAELTAAIKACEIAKSRDQRQITIVTDSKYLHSAATNWIDKWSSGVWLDHKGKPVVNEKLFKQLLYVKSGLDIEWVHVRGHADTPGNIRADNLARAALEGELTALCGALTTGYKLQNDCQEIRDLRRDIERGLKQHLTIEDDLICFTDSKLPKEDQKRIYVPEQSRPWLMNLSHDNPIHGGHLGVKKTYRKLLRYWWPGMSRDVERYIRSCETCQRFKNPAGLPPGYLQSIPVSKVFEHVHVDMVGPVKTTYRGNSYIITATDAFSKWAFARACQTIKTSDVIKFMEECILAVHGKPQVLITDRGAQFTSAEWKLWLEKHRIPHHLTTPRHPQSNGIDERFNGTLARILRTHVDDEQSNWDEELKWALYVYNTSVHDSTGYSPYQLIHGLDPRSPLKNNELGDETGPEQLQRVREQIRQGAVENIKRAQSKQKLEYDRRHSVSQIKVGDTVLARELFISTEFSKKFHPRWYGPCIVISLIGEPGNPKAVKLVDCEDLKQKIVSIEDVKPYVERQQDQLIRKQTGEGDTCPDMQDLHKSSYYIDCDPPNLMSFDEPAVGKSNKTDAEWQEPLSPERRVRISDYTTTHAYIADEPLYSSTPERHADSEAQIDQATELEGNLIDISTDNGQDQASVRDELSTEETVQTWESNQQAEQRQRQETQADPQPQVEPQRYVSPYIMNFIHDNSTTDPTYKPPSTATSGQTSSQSTAGSGRRKNLSVESLSTLSNRSSISSHVDSPIPQRRYNLRPNARRNFTYNINPNDFITSSDTRGTTQDDLSPNSSVASYDNAALTSDSEADEDVTLIPST